jgi:hypothetical protein
MAIKLESTSYPWLAIAQFYQVPYGEVLKLVDSMDRGAVRPEDFFKTDWEFAVRNRWVQRQEVGL